MNLRTRRLVIDMIIAIIATVSLSLLMLPIRSSINNYDLAIGAIGIIWVALRYGAPAGIVSGALAGLGLGLINMQPIDWSVILLAYVLPFLSLGFAGLFAQNTQRTLNNRRYSSTYLNIGTGSLLAVILYFIIKYWLSPFVLNLTSELSIDSLGFWLSMGLSWLIIAGVLAFAGKLKPDILIPKRTKYLSRKETSSLLND